VRFDHAVVAVRDLAAATERMRAAGFDVRPGGRHVGFGTENAIIRFGLDYIELITVHDEALAERASVRSRELVEFLRQRPSGFVGYALATDELRDIAKRLRAIGQEFEGPTPMRRQRPDGVELRWELLIPGGVAWRRPWPFFINWGIPDAERVKVEQPGEHAIGAVGITGIVVEVRDLAAARPFYEAVLGPPLRGDPHGVSFRIGTVTIDVVGMAPDVAGRTDATPGPSELRLRAPANGDRAASVEMLPDVRFVLAA
jgi:catechol 2,3-dioxygenase-like lactoylglutathione lyase family enzyme